MDIDPVLAAIVVGSIAIMLFGAALSKLKQPFIIAFILTGVLIGPSLLGIVSDQGTLVHVQSIGIVLLMFFIGMEVSLPKLLARWRIAILGTLAQIALTVAVVWAVSIFTDWSFAKVLLISFAMSLSSTAVVVRMLEMRKEHDTPIGQSVLGVTLVQDIMIAPMIIILTLLGAGTRPQPTQLAMLLGGVLLIIVLVLYLFVKREIRFPFKKLLQKHKQLQIFLAAIVCFGFALVTGMLGLSTALGAFIAGIYVSRAKETHWIYDKMHSFHTVFIAIFFVAIGTMIDLQFLKEHFLLAIGMVFVLLITNTFVNAATLRLLGGTKQESMYFGALLAQAGEFSFVLAGAGLALAIISGFAHQLLIIVIALSLLLSPLWVQLITSLTPRENN